MHLETKLSRRDAHELGKLQIADFCREPGKAPVT